LIFKTVIYRPERLGQIRRIRITLLYSWVSLAILPGHGVCLFDPTLPCIGQGAAAGTGGGFPAGEPSLVTTVSLRPQTHRPAGAILTAPTSCSFFYPTKALQPSRHPKTFSYFPADQHVTSSPTSPFLPGLHHRRPPARGGDNATGRNGLCARCLATAALPTGGVAAHPSIYVAPALTDPTPPLRAVSCQSRSPQEVMGAPLIMLTPISQGRTNPLPHKDARQRKGRSRLRIRWRGSPHSQRSNTCGADRASKKNQLLRLGAKTPPEFFGRVGNAPHSSPPPR